MNYNKHLFIASFLYFVLWIIASNFLIHGINPDSISYISISKKYFDGNFSEAINAYWGPLFSWILLPSYIIKVEPHILARILFGVFSIILFILIDKFLIKFQLNEKIRSLGIYFFVLPAIFFSFYRLTPDYLLLILTLSYVYTTLEKKYWNKKSLVLISAVLGALMFLTKSYGLMFFLAFQSILILIEFISNKKISKIVISNYLLSVVTILILISPWIYLLSNKYGSFTISSSGSVNIRIVNPELNFRHPSIESGFVAPSDKFSTSAWDDPNIKAYPEWNPFSNLESSKYFFINTVKNILKLFLFILAFAPLLSSLIFFIKIKDFQNSVLLKIIFAGLIYGLGYTTIYVENRYIWPSLILFSFVGLIVLNSNYNQFFKNKTRLVLISLFIIFSFVPFFIYGIKQQLPTTYAYHQANSIKNNFKVSGNFASTNYWDHGLALSYFLNSKFFGTEKLPINSYKLVEKAKKNGIEYIFDYSELMSDKEKLNFIGKIDSVRIFKVIYDQ